MTDFHPGQLVRVEGAPGYDDFDAFMWDGRIINGKVILLDDGVEAEAFVIEDQYIKPYPEELP